MEGFGVISVASNHKHKLLLAHTIVISCFFLPSLWFSPFGLLITKEDDKCVQKPDGSDIFYI